jgi:phosphoglycerate dehydrogenase-like enzyme
MTKTLAHQYVPEIADAIAPRLPEGVRFVALGSTAPECWRVPQEADALLINQDSPAIGIGPDMKRPEGWPFNLEWVHLRSTGIDRFPNWIFEVSQVTVTRGGYAVPIAEYVMAAILAQAKSIPGIWVGSREAWGKHRLGQLEDRTLGIVGYGRIGAGIARRAQAFDMRVLGTKRTATSGTEDGVEIVPLARLLAESDHIVIATPLTEETHHLIDAKAFAAMKPGAHLVNIGRGAVIDSEALRVALDGDLGGASLDVFDPEPPPDGHWAYNHPKLRLSPHVSGGSPDTPRRVTDFFLANLERFLAGDRLEGLVNRDAGY